MDRRQLFIELSSILTGETVVDKKVADAHFRHASAKLGSQLAVLLATFATIPPERRRPDFDRLIWRNTLLRPTAEKIAVLWFVGGIPLFDGDKLVGFDYHDTASRAVHAEGVFGALMWRVLSAHPPGLSGGYFGYWRYPPEN